MLDKFLYREEWILAVRKRSDKLLFESNGTYDEFNIIPNTKRYWCADPFLFRYKEKTYVFFEMYDRWKERGLIGYREVLSENKFSDMKVVLDCGHHLSYPNIFEYNGEVYFVPESYMAGKIVLYKAANFPSKWEKCEVLVDDIVACDTTFIDENYMITMTNNETNTKTEAVLFKKENNVWGKTKNNPVDNNPRHARCAGKIFRYNNKLIRPSQNGVGGYGMGIVFREINTYGENEYKETSIAEIKISDIKYNDSKKYDGIHTYNFDEEYEIIDLKIAKAFHVISIISRYYGKVSRLLRRLVGKLYGNQKV